MTRQVNPRALRPHPDHEAIYGDDSCDELAAQIQASGWVHALVITSQDIIISSHRRWRAALALGLATVPVEVRTFTDAADELEALLLENATRDKTTEQRTR